MPRQDEAANRVTSTGGGGGQRDGRGQASFLISYNSTDRGDGQAPWRGVGRGAVWHKTADGGSSFHFYRMQPASAAGHHNTPRFGRASHPRLNRGIIFIKGGQS